MFPQLLMLFIMVPLIELYLLYHLVMATNFAFTLLLVIFTGVLGSYLMRRQGIKLLGLIQTDLSEGRMPADHMLSGLLVLVGGALLLTPGMLTDIVGFLLMVPGNRRVLLNFLKKRFSESIKNGSQQNVFFFSTGGSPNPFMQESLGKEPRAEDEIVVNAEDVNDSSAKLDDKG